MVAHFTGGDLGLRRQVSVGSALPSLYPHLIPAEYAGKFGPLGAPD